MKMADNGKCFSFLWRLENINYYYQNQEKQITSPAFVVDGIEKTKWTLRLNTKGHNDQNCIGYFLNREKDSNGEEKMEIKYELACLNADGSIFKIMSNVRRVFCKDDGFGYNEFLKLQKGYISKRSANMPQDSLTLLCRMWKSHGAMPEDVRCIAVTRIGVEKRSFIWKIVNFSSLEPDKKCSFEIKSKLNGVPLMSVDLCVIGGLTSEEIRFELSLQDDTIKFSTFQVFLINAAGNKVEGNKEEIWFDDPAQSQQFTFSFTKKKLLENKNTYLPNGTLSFLWECTFSKGVVSEEIEEDKNRCICVEVKISDALKVNSNHTTLFNCMASNLKFLYDEHFLSDVKLKTNTSVFPSHKFILSASSSVFKAMFSNDMKENLGDCVSIEDLGDDAIRRMLLFLYTAQVEDLTWKSASDLYLAADKYAIQNLKDICSSFLKDNLTSSNACEVLLLSDSHADDDLKTFVQKYILKNGKQITNSDEWEDLIQTDAKLAAKTLSIMFK